MDAVNDRQDNALLLSGHQDLIPNSDATHLRLDSPTTRTESLGEGVVAENTIGGVLLGRFEAALGMSLCRGNGLVENHLERNDSVGAPVSHKPQLYSYSFIILRLIVFIPLPITAFPPRPPD
jgi:hypothetical protein